MRVTTFGCPFLLLACASGPLRLEAMKNQTGKLVLQAHGSDPSAVPELSEYEVVEQTKATVQLRRAGGERLLVTFMTEGADAPSQRLGERVLEGIVGDGSDFGCVASEAKPMSWDGRTAHVLEADCPTVHATTMYVRIVTVRVDPRAFFMIMQFASSPPRGADERAFRALLARTRLGPGIPR